ncbi:MAG: ABC transporter substrate-binding protein [Polyangiaceae bacterium]|jgi:iron complex transport system substrate-binding protein|nr:ABC transporter substrate-binding protein [Polyangiaceae bacterium]
MRTEAGIAVASLVALALAGRAAPSPALLDPRRLTASTVEEGDFPKRMVDPGGREVVLRARPGRVVSRALVADELLLELAPPERLAALTYLVDDATMSLAAGKAPPSIRRTGGGLEELLSLEPDLVVVAEFSEGSTTAQLLSAGVPVLRLGNAGSFEAVFDDLRNVGAALGASVEARRTIEQMQGRIEQVQRQVAGRPRPRALYLSGGQYTAGPGTLTHQSLTLAGGHNAAAELGLSGAFPLPVEQLVALAPEVVLLASPEPSARLARPSDLPPNIPWAELPAARHHRIYLVPAAWSGAISHHAIRALEAFAALLHAPPQGPP